VAGAFRVLPAILFFAAPAVYFFLWRPQGEKGLP